MAAVSPGMGQHPSPRHLLPVEVGPDDRTAIGSPVAFQKFLFFFFCIKKILIPPGIIRERKSKSPRGTTSEKLTRVGEDVEKLEPRSAKLGTEPRRTAWRFFVKLKIEFACDPAIPLLGIDPKEWKAGAQAHICPPVFTAASRTRAQR